MVRLFSLIVFLPLLAAAQELPPDGMIPPRVLQKSEPEYTEEARAAGLEGMVVVHAIVGEDGVATEIRVAKSLGLGLDEKAVDAVTTWRFAPGTKRGTPVSEPVTIEVVFRSLTKTTWHLGSAMCDAPDGASWPTVDHPSFPQESPKSDVSVAISFDVNETGVPVNLDVEKSSDEMWIKATVASMRQWRFKPALRDGKPVPARCTWEFAHGYPSTPTSVVIR